MKRAALTMFVILAVTACSKREAPSPETAPEVVATVAPSETVDTTATAAPEASSREAELSGKLASYSATRLDGTPWVAGEQKGKVLLLNVWATWCGPCRFEIPELKKMQAEFATRGFEVVGIAVDEAPNNEQDVKTFVEEKAIDYPVVLDPEGRILLTLETSTVPTTVLLDRSGQVIWFSVGIVQADDPALTEALAKALAQ